MRLIPEDNLNSKLSLNLTPMLDFLFLIFAFFATLAVSRSNIFDTKLDLAKLKREGGSQQIGAQQSLNLNINVTSLGKYFWVTEVHDYPMENLEKVQKELLYQYNLGVLPKEKGLTKVLLHVDKRAPWESVAKLVFAIREVGFEAYPVYEGLN
jgi:biopolymer transport protein ExbD